MNISEGSGDHVSTPLTQAQLGSRGKTILGGGEQLGIVLGLDTVLLTTYNTNFELHNDVRTIALVEKFLSDIKVVLEWHRRSIPHVRLEQR